MTGPQTVGPQTVGAGIYQRLRQDIIMGRLRPGQRLRLDQMKLDYPAGASTLREALSRLAADGFVLAEGQRGFQVAPVSPDGLREIADLRLLIEEAALRLSFANGTLDWEVAVIAAHHRLDAHEEQLEDGVTDQIAEWRLADWRFHQALISACGSAVMMQTHAEVFDKYLRYQMVALAFRPAASRPEHQALKDAAIARDADAAVALLRHHLSAGVAQALALAGSWAEVTP
ncbi:MULTISPECIES: GntR family transcriptional regulator [Paracoccus]|uniref:FCD domain-containing protein n=1 Tax=Paracoccus litorisediminis TaxID=2006130 RepID=A0A844HM26_9RHOB|nr:MULTISPECIES: GntR family transcriptional regulator [Paracoccus]MBD9527180.1 GntR family transcriptional regulator [Paracoccus sp. PAR01]MTH59427.1 FCD domain-containing protein [Paracoccus litorisediminis]